MQSILSINNQTDNEKISDSYLMTDETNYKTKYEELKKEYSYSMHELTHEIGNISTLINSSLQIIESSHPDVKSFKHWNSTTSDVQHLINLLSQLSTFNNCSKLNIEFFNIIDLVDSVINSFKSKYTYINFVFTTKITSHELYVYADKTKLKQVIINLIKNATESFDSSHADSKCNTIVPNDKDIKNNSTTGPNFMNNTTKKSPSITVLISDNAKCIFIKVIDNGCGIPDEQIDLIFNPMISFKPKGTGLGLPISKRIIESHNGKITISSNNEGTCFNISLPKQTKQE